MTSRARHLARRLLSCFAREDGITMIVLLGVMTVTSLLVIVAFTSANGEVHLTATDTAQKKAYYAAEAGVQDYEYHLTEDGNYLDYCTEPTPENKALNQYYKTPAGTEALKPSELHTVELPESEGSASEERYAIELIPAESDERAGDKQCDRNHLVETMVEEKGSATGTFRIKSVGFSGNAVSEIVATFRNANFVSYVWYTIYEVADPSVNGPPSSYWSECGTFYKLRVEIEKKTGKQCQTFNNYFGTGESVNGPMHVEDHVGVCGEPVFGRSAGDLIEFGNRGSESEESYSGELSSCGTPKPKFLGTHVPPKDVPTIPPPPGDEELIHIVEPGYHFFGKTEIVLENAVMTINQYAYNIVTGKVEVTTTHNVAYPKNGVIYVSAGKADAGPLCSEYSPFAPNYTEDTECADVYVNGKYTESLTIASENNVIINGSLLTPTSPEDTANATPTTNALLGLVANNFIRIYHPLEGTREMHYTKCGNTKNSAAKDLSNPIIYAAMLALNHAILVDDFDCGAPLGHLNVYGALAGKYSNGMTGVINGTTVEHGYSYNAQYDNRLQVEEPPHFLNPIQAAWYIRRQTLAKAP